MAATNGGTKPPPRAPARRPAARRTTGSQDKASQGEKRGAQPRANTRTATVTLPFVTAQVQLRELRIPELPSFPRPQLPVPRVRAGDVTGAVAGLRARLPEPREAAYYVGLGLLGALQVIDWPVAVAIGAGTALARRSSGGQAGAAGPQPSDPSTG